MSTEGQKNQESSVEALQLQILMSIKPSTVKCKSNSWLFVAVFRIHNTFFIMCLNKEYLLTWKGFEMWRGKHGSQGQQHCCLKRTRICKLCINLQIYKFGLVPVHKGFVLSREKNGNVYTYNILLSLLKLMFQCRLLWGKIYKHRKFIVVWKIEFISG